MLRRLPKQRGASRKARALGRLFTVFRGSDNEAERFASEDLKGQGFDFDNEAFPVFLFPNRANSVPLCLIAAEVNRN